MVEESLASSSQKSAPKDLQIVEYRVPQCKKYEKLELKWHSYCSVLIHEVTDIPYILESNPHPFYSFRGLKSQWRIRFAVESWILEKG
jgi:hypothetical protein